MVLAKTPWNSGDLEWRFQIFFEPSGNSNTDNDNIRFDFGKENASTLTDVVAAILAVKFEKAAGNDKIRSEMLKAVERRRSTLVHNGVSDGVATRKTTK